MITRAFENRRTLAAALSLAGALAIVLLSLTAAALGGNKTGALYPRTVKLTDDKIAHWAVLMRPAVVRSKPGLASRIITKLPTGTTEDRKSTRLNSSH